ncbi:MAG: sulfatase-like hydrolase/transferase [Planctomycetota bacterium]
MQAPEEDIERYKHIADKKRRVYAAMVDVMDRGIGEVLEAVNQNGLREKTLVFFLSDNGGPQASKQKPGKWNGSSNKPFRGGKGDLYEGGVHVPFIASWPGTIPAGTIYESPVIALDISRTAVAVAGASPGGKHAMEGVDLIPYVTGEKIGAPHEALFWKSGSKWSVLAADRMKHVRESDKATPQLFYLPKDIAEANDMASSDPERARELSLLWEKWNEENVPCRLMGYIDYHKRRDVFFKRAIPEEAKKSGYVPQFKPNFK